MNITKLFCFGDGFAAGHIWPEWPDILQALYPNVEVKNYGKIGAGNEYIVNCIIDAHKKNPDAFFCVQWADPCRFDKLLHDDSWTELIANDPVYHFNFAEIGLQKWWLSSASQIEEIKTYHSFYIAESQAIQRTYNYMYFVQHLLKNNFLFFLTVNLRQQHIFQEFPIIYPDMELFSRQEQYKDIRGNQVQPSPPVHLDFLKKHVLDKLPLFLDKHRFDSLEKSINDFEWVPYHPDRLYLWEQLTKR